MTGREPHPVLLRSMLFTPASRLDLIAKALRSGTDAVIADLEDAVAEEQKPAAREKLAEIGPTDIPLFVRVNGAETDHLWPDVVAAARIGPAGIVLPKAEDPDVIRRLDGALTAIEVETCRPVGSTSIVPLIESTKGVLRAGEVFAASSRIETSLFGSGENGDLIADIGGEWTPDGVALVTSRSLFVLAARAAGMPSPMDAVFMDFRDLDGLRSECLLARRMGCVGKVAIHPGQIPVIHEVFTPSDEAVAKAERVIALFDEALANGSASIGVDGKMIDYAVVRQARMLLARAAGQRR